MWVPISSSKIGVGETVRRLSRLTAAQWLLLARAVATLGAASAAVAIVPFRRAVAFGAVNLQSPGNRRSVRDCVWAVEAAARRVPWRAMCFEQGLAVQRLLRKSGVDAVLHYGARQSPASRLEAHVWVSVGGETVIGGEMASQFQLIASFP